MTLTLRPYQLEALDAIRAGYKRGIRRPLVSLPTGTGKTILFSAIASSAMILDRDAGVLVLAHRDELLSQAADKMHQYDPALDSLTVGLVKAEADQWDRPVVVASVQTLARARRLARVERRFRTIIVDECFAPGTLVDGTPIEERRTGDIISAYHAESKPVFSRDRYGLLWPGWAGPSLISATMQSVPSGLVRVTAEGESFVCTPGHPFLTTDGWIPAAELSGRVVYATRHANADVRGVPRADRRDDEEPTGQSASEQARLLREDVQRSLAGAAIERAHGGDEPPTRERPDERTQPDAAPRVEGEDAPDVARASANRARRERLRAYASRADHGDGSWLGATRGPDGEAEAAGLADSLQARSGKSRPDDRNRDRRTFSRLFGPPGAGRAESRVPRLARVDRVEVLERGSDGTYGGLLPQGVVHNLEVAGPETYTVGALGLVVHNCHHAAADSYQRVLDGLGSFEPDGPLTLGVTATPQRADSLGLDETFQEVVYHRDILSMIRAGYLCDLKGRQVKLHALDLTKARIRRGDFVEAEVGEMLEAAEAPYHGVRAWKRYAAGRKTIVFTPTIALAHEFAAEFRKEGVAAVGLSGETKLEERRAILRRFHSDELEVVANAQVLTEGFDEPNVQCIMIARPTKSQPLYVQMVGRGTRIYPGKPDCLVMDLVGATERLDLTTLPRLFGLGDDEAYGDVTEALEQTGVSELAGLKEQRLVREGRITATEVSLFGQQKLAWTTVRPGQWALPAGDDMLVVKLLGGAEGAERYAVDRLPRHGSPMRLQSGLDLSLAMGVAEDTARNSSGFNEHLVSRDAAWRGGPASSKQIAALRKLKVLVPDGCSKGEASDLMAAAIARKRAS